MGWKNWPSWLKFSAIFLLTYIITVILTWFFFLNLPLPDNLYFFIQDIILVIAPIIIFYPNLLLASILPIKPIFNPLGSWVYYAPTSLDIIISLIVLGIFYFIIGAIIGWLYGKIKSRNQSHLNQNT